MSHKGGKNDLVVCVCVRVGVQWRIQDFPDGGANTQGGCANLSFGQIFPENSMKMKEIGLGTRVPGTSPPPLRSANWCGIFIKGLIIGLFLSVNKFYISSYNEIIYQVFFSETVKKILLLTLLVGTSIWFMNRRTEESIWFESLPETNLVCSLRHYDMISISIRLLHYWTKSYIAHHSYIHSYQGNAFNTM